VRTVLSAPTVRRRSPALVASGTAATAMAMAAALAGCSGGGGDRAVAAAAARHPAPTCGLVGASAVQRALGLNVNPPTPVVSGPVTVCTYTGTSSTPSTVIVRFATDSSTATYEAAKAQFAAHQEPTVDVAGLGKAAYSSTLNAAGLDQNTIVVLKGSTELLISAPAPLAQVEALARQVLPSL